MAINRREFLSISGGVLVGLGALGFSRTARANTPVVGKPASRHLVVLYLGGGNDGLNTIAPVGMGSYYDLRRNIGLKEHEVLPLTSGLGLHPNLKGMKALYDQGKVAIVQGVGYPEPDRSHFRSFDIWATGQHKGVSPVGWLGKYLDMTGGSAENALRAISVSGAVPKPLVGATGAAVAIQSAEGFKIRGMPGPAMAIREMYQLGDGPLAIVRGKGDSALNAADQVQALSSAYKSPVTYPRSGLARNLQLIVRLLAGGSESQVLYTQMGGFDDHAGLKRHHDMQMQQLDEALSAFQADLEAQGLGDQVITLIHSEFGRRARENGSGGTDHGAAGPVILLGGPVRGGIVGEHPSLTNLLNGDLRASIDFRSVYTTLINGWLGGPTAAEVLGARYDALPLLAP